MRWRRGSTSSPRTALGATMLVFRGGVLEVDSAETRKSGKPGQNVGKLFSQVLFVGSLDRAGELSNLFDEPNEGAGDAAPAA